MDTSALGGGVNSLLVTQAGTETQQSLTDTSNRKREDPKNHTSNWPP